MWLLLFFWGGELTTSKRIAFVSTVPYFLVAQLGSQIRFLLEHGIYVTVITSSGKELVELPKHENLCIITISIPRKISPLQDIKSLFSLFLFFRSHHIDLLHSTTPKAGLLCAIAGWSTGVQIRLHTFTGQPWAIRKGLMRAVMRASDRVIVSLMTHCYADSPSQRDFLIQQGIASPDDLSVIGHGSLGGVDIKRFSRERWSSEQCLAIRRELSIPDDSFVIVYIGRITADKGIHELLMAFDTFQQSRNAHLLLIGPPDEDGVGLLEQADTRHNVSCLGYQSEPERFLAIADILCLPSYREGFGTVVIEAASMGVPTVGTKIPGLVDAVEDGVTGRLVQVRDIDSLRRSFVQLADDRKGRLRLGAQARERAHRLFAADVVGAALLTEYEKWWNGIFRRDKDD